MKKVLIAIGVLVGLVAVTAVVFPLVYDVNKNIKPKIEAALNENLNAHSEIGELSLSLWTGIKIGVSKLVIKETAESEAMLAIENAKLSIPFLSLLTGKLSVTLLAESPTVRVNRDKAGVLNFAKIIKPKAEVEPQSAPQKETGDSSAAGSVGKRLYISIDFSNANLIFTDAKTGLKKVIKEGNLQISDIGLGRDIPMHIRGHIDVSGMKGLLVNGQFGLDGVTNVSLEGGQLKEAKFEAKLDLTNLSIVYGDLFNKAPKVPLTASLNIAATNDKVDLVAAKYIINDFSIEQTGTFSLGETVQFSTELNSNQLELGQWQGVLKPLADFQVRGRAGFNIKASGAGEKVSYAGNINLEEGTFLVPGVKPRAEQLSVNITINTDSVTFKEAKMKIGTSDFNLTGRVNNFAAPKVKMSFQSQLMDLDEMLGSEVKKEAVKVEATAEQTPEEQAAQDAKTEAAVQNTQRNKAIKNLEVEATAKIKKLIVKKAPLEDFDSEVTFKNLVLTLKKANLKAFSGKIQTTSEFDLSKKDPNYKFDGSVQGLNVNAAMVNQFPEFDKFLEGDLNSKFSISGSGVTSQKVKNNLAGKGSFEILNGSWSGLSILKLVAEKLKSIPQAGDKVGNVVVGNRFKFLKGNFNIKSARFNLENAVADLEEARTGLTMKGFVGFDKSMEMTGLVLTPMNDVPNKLKQADGRTGIPFRIVGSAIKPEINWDATLKPVAAAYLEHEGKKALQKGVDELKKQVTPEKVKDLFKGLGF